MKITYINLCSNSNISSSLLLEYSSGISDLFYTLSETEIDFATKNSSKIPPEEILALIESGGIGAVALFNDKVVGALLLRPRSGGILELMMGVDKLFRGYGLGTTLIEKAAILAKNGVYNSICLLVSEKNIPAVNLYKKTSFKMLGVSKRNYFKHGNTVNVIFMERKL